MRRGIQIVVSIVAVLILLRPFDCFATGPRTREAMNCCLKGKCAPSKNADGCCKNTVPDANQFIGSKAAGHWAPVVALAPASASQLVPTFLFEASVDLPRHPPPRGSLSARNLPLLI